MNKNIYSKDIIKTLQLLMIKYNLLQQEDESFEIPDEEENFSQKVLHPVLKPDSPTFIKTPSNVRRSRLSVKEQTINIDDDLLLIDLFSLINNKNLAQFGLPDISLSDLANNNITQAIIVINKKGMILDIITNKGANPAFVQALINRDFEKNINKLSYTLKNKLTPFKE
jgi:hypothetical protein